MKKTKKMYAGNLYIFQSTACSNTAYFEQLDDTKNFLDLANQHLKDYLYIHEYMLSKDGWIFMARLKSKEAITAAYNNKRKKYKKLAKDLPVWKIISEQMRLFISAYVTSYNANTGREGVLVRRPYQRFYFETVKEAKLMIRRVRRRLVGLQQAKKMYRAKKGHYRIPKKAGNGGIYLSSRRKKNRNGEVRFSSLPAVFQQLTKQVEEFKLKTSVKNTKKAHQHPIPDF